MRLWFYILLASVLVLTFEMCAESYHAPECNHSTYAGIMQRITYVMYHTLETARDSYRRTKQYIDHYKVHFDQRQTVVENKLYEISAKLVDIHTAVLAITTGPTNKISPTNVGNEITDRLTVDD
ncbi:uncharacterized protein LOC116339273 isoform X2 [Contarinia nasturtii]|uniref:uncharacterized protein LOC116339273 isoform X2 n=1 Tax=Contarinia nasturtii TaxID=265458 RepID=UPI0012D432F9|nr:uncharacterized protein LOC116339273 isoform X2 [Contarinia nasturtii]